MKRMGVCFLGRGRSVIPLPLRGCNEWPNALIHFPLFFPFLFIALQTYARFTGAPLKVHKISNPWRSPSGKLYILAWGGGVRKKKTPPVNCMEIFGFHCLENFGFFIAWEAHAGF